MVSNRPAMVLFAILAILLIIATDIGYLGIDIGAFFVFVIVLGSIMFWDRKKVKLEGIVFIRRTQKGKNFIDRTSKRHRGFWKRWATLGVIVAIPVMIFGTYYLGSQAFMIMQGAAEGGVRLILPGPVSQPVNIPGVFVVPWWIWVIGIAAVIIPHEFMHGVVCRLDKIKIKSVGWILLIVIPGAFVEPDEKQLQKAKRRTRMKVYAAGSFANLAVALLMIIIMIGMFTASFQPTGIFVSNVNGTPANASGVFGTLYEAEGKSVKTVNDLATILNEKKPGDSITLKVATENSLIPVFTGWDIIIPKVAVATNLSEAEEYNIILAESPTQPGKAYLGVYPQFSSYQHKGDLTLYRGTTNLLLWIFVFSFGIGLVNLLPIKPLDGGLLFEEIIGHFTRRKKIIVKTVSIILIFLILFNLIGPIFL